VVSEDGAVSIQLTDDAAMQLSLDWTPAETAGSAVLAGVGRRWNADGSDDIASMGVYTATLQFDALGNPTGLTAAPSFLVSLGTAIEETDGTIHPDIWTPPSFSPDMTKLVADRYLVNQGLRIVDVATGAVTELTPGTAEYPEWSPSGAKIAFRVVGIYYDTIETVSPNGSGRSIIFKGRTGERVFKPSWSPDSGHVAVMLFSERTIPWVYDIYRVGAAGGSKVNLTADLSGSAYLAGWR
jgi:Tol biopolymer transport system component